MSVDHLHRPVGQALARTGASDAKPAFRLEQRTVPAAYDVAALSGQIAVELLGEWQADMGAAVYIAEHAVAPAQDEAMEAPGFELKHKIAGSAVGDVRQRAECDTSGGGEEAFVAAHAGSPSG